MGMIRNLNFVYYISVLLCLPPKGRETYCFSPCVCPSVRPSVRHKSCPVRRCVMHKKHTLASISLELFSFDYFPYNLLSAL